MKRLNIFGTEFEHDDDDPEGYSSGYVKLAPAIGGSTMAGTIYDLPPGNSNCPFHYESDEEWLLVLEGTLTVRHAEGEDELAGATSSASRPAPTASTSSRTAGPRTCGC